MAAHRDGQGQPAQAKQAVADKGPIKAHEVAKVYKTMGLESDASRRRYLDWSEEGRPEPQTNFEVVERGDTRSF